MLAAAVETSRSAVVADDSGAVRKLVGAVLRRDGFEVREASDGDEAWRLVQERTPDLLVVDDVLPCISGVEHGEDFDLILRLHQLMRDEGRPYTIGHVPNVVCWTIVPDTARVLARQRRRWHRGLQQVLLKHRDMTFRPRYHVVGILGLPWAWLYELISPIVIPVAIVTTVVGYLVGYISGQVFLLSLLVAWLIAVSATLAALLMTETPGGSARGWRSLAAVVAAVFLEIPYQCLTLVYRIQTLLRPRQKVVWGEMGRSVGA